MKFPRRILGRGLAGLAWVAGALLTSAVLVNAATIGTSSYLHVNLSYMPFSYYDASHSAASYNFSSSCPSGASVRSCFQTVLGQLWSPDGKRSEADMTLGSGLRRKRR